MAHFYSPIARSLFGAPLLQFHFTANSKKKTPIKSVHHYKNAIIAEFTMNETAQLGLVNIPDAFLLIFDFVNNRYVMRP